MTERSWRPIALAVLALLGCGDEQEPSAAPATADRRPNADGALPCTQRSEPTNFDAYWVGREFEGLPLSGVERKCTQPSSLGPPQARLNVVEYHYGDCEPPPREGGCPLPLSIQSWPRCERGLSPYHSGNLTIRGVPARYQGGGLALLTGDALVAIFANDSERLLRAAGALVKAPARPSDLVAKAKPSGPLPAVKPPPRGCASRRPDPAVPESRRPPS